MKQLRYLLLSGLLYAFHATSWADAVLPVPNEDYNTYSQQTSENTKTLAQYLLNLGGYLGYNISQASSTISQQLLNASSTQVAQLVLFYTTMGAIPVNTIGDSLKSFVPQNSAYSKLNQFANATFATPPYEVANPQTVSVSNLIDQTAYQHDPVSQALLNILSTPNDSYCLNKAGTDITPNCNYLYRGKVINNIIGSPLPGPDKFFSSEYNLPFLSQLNGNILLAPLMYSTSEQNTNNNGQQVSQSPLLPAQTQAQQAANFIRYATASIVPLTLAKYSEYEAYADNVSLLSKPNPTPDDRIQQLKAQTELATYLANLRIFAAQSSAVFSNFYYFMAKRMPQNLDSSAGGDQKNTSSQALNEFKLATWRLYNPEQSDDKQWITQINQASPATVQKEIAILLAEINYQMYLSRQQDERLLFTATMQLQNARGIQPSLSSVKHSNEAANNDD